MKYLDRIYSVWCFQVLQLSCTTFLEADRPLAFYFFVVAWQVFETGGHRWVGAPADMQHPLQCGASAAVAPRLLHKWWNCKSWLVIFQPTSWGRALDNTVTPSPTSFTFSVESRSRMCQPACVCVRVCVCLMGLCAAKLRSEFPGGRVCHRLSGYDSRVAPPGWSYLSSR